MNDDLTVEEAAAALLVTKPTVRKYIHEGRLPAYRRGPRTRGPGGGFWIRRNDLELFRLWYTGPVGVRHSTGGR